MPYIIGVDHDVTEPENPTEEMRRRERLQRMRLAAEEPSEEELERQYVEARREVDRYRAPAMEGDEDALYAYLHARSQLVEPAHMREDIAEVVPEWVTTEPEWVQRPTSEPRGTYITDEELHSAEGDDEDILAAVTRLLGA